MMLTPQDTAMRLGCEPGDVNRMIRSGVFPGARKVATGGGEEYESTVPSRWVIPEREVVAYEREMARSVDTVEAGAILGLPRQTVWKLLRQGKFPGAEKVGGRWRIPRKSIADYEPDKTRSGRRGYPIEVVREAIARVGLGERQADVARLLGVSQATVYRWRRGERRGADS